MLGKEVRITFLDHVIDDVEPVKCTVWGKVVKITSKYITISHWEVESDCKEVVENNREVCCIVRSTIMAIKEL